MENFDNNIFDQLEKPVVKKTRTASIVVSVVLLIFAALAAATSEVFKLQKDGATTEMKLMYFFGTILIFGLIAAAVIIIIFRFKSVNVRANTMLVISSLVFTLLVASCCADVIKGKQKEREQELATCTKFSQLSAMAYSGEKINDLDFSKDKYGVNAEFLSSCFTKFNELVDERKNFEAKLNSFDFSKYCNKKSLSSKETLHTALIEAEDMKNAVDSYKTGYEKFLKEFEELLKDMKVSESYKESLKKGYDSGVGAAHDSMNNYFRIENEYIDAVCDYYNFFDKLNGNFEIKNNVFLFYNQKEIDGYNELVGKINSLAEEENKLIEDNEKTRNDHMEKMKKYEDSQD